MTIFYDKVRGCLYNREGRYLFIKESICEKDVLELEKKFNIENYKKIFCKHAQEIGSFKSKGDRDQVEEIFNFFKKLSFRNLLYIINKNGGNFVRMCKRFIFLTNDENYSIYRILMRWVWVLKQSLVIYLGPYALYPFSIYGKYDSNDDDVMDAAIFSLNHLGWCEHINKVESYFTRNAVDMIKKLPYRRFNLCFSCMKLIGNRHLLNCPKNDVPICSKCL